MPRPYDLPAPAADDRHWWALQLDAARRVVQAGAGVGDRRLVTLGPRVPETVAGLAEALDGGDRAKIEHAHAVLGGAYELNLDHVPPDLEAFAAALIDLNEARYLRRPAAGGAA